jgi:hypothetical protein
MCSGNGNTPDFECGTGYHLKYDHGSITGTDRDTCCDKTISGMCTGNTLHEDDHICSSGYSDKVNFATISGLTDAACCDAITGMCSGNLKPVGGNCPSDHKETDGSATTCDVDCTDGYHLKPNHQGSAGSTPAACCDATIDNRCAGNNADLGNYNGGTTEYQCPAASPTAYVPRASLETIVVSDWTQARDLCCKPKTGWCSGNHKDEAPGRQVCRKLCQN